MVIWYSRNLQNISFFPCVPCFHGPPTIVAAISSIKKWNCKRQKHPITRPRPSNCQQHPTGANFHGPQTIPAVTFLPKLGNSMDLKHTLHTLSWSPRPSCHRQHQTWPSCGFSWPSNNSRYNFSPEKHENKWICPLHMQMCALRVCDYKARTLQSSATFNLTYMSIFMDLLQF